MNAKSIYDNLVDVQGLPSSILTYSDKEDCIIIEIQDYNKSVFKFAREFFKGYKSTDIIYTNEDKTAVWYNDVSVYSDRETIEAITDFYYRAKVKGLVESKKSMKESINSDCYIYYDDDDNKRLVFCDYVKGITDTSDWFYLNEDIIDAIHIFKNEKQAQKFIDEHLKYFADQDKVVIAEYPQTVSGFFESKKSARKSIKEERYNVELSDYSGSIVDEETFDKKSDAIQWAKDNGRNCYARIWDNEEGKTVKEWKVKSIKESKVMTFEEFKKLCNDNFGYAIMDFNEYKGAYIVVVSSNEKATELFTKALRKKGLECTFYELKDPNSEYYRCYEIMCV